ncbi:MAG: Extracellular solute-binding protein, partial [Candidatus Hydrogenedentes bacterium]|nr:Extracellular solute-binding protein [Candidatus Hydrogenedentota bacterium]
QEARPPLTLTPAQKRFFCRVPKARELPRQTRRCSYDFVAGRGLVFYETYPGDGHVVMFHENAAMSEEWDIFQKRDIPDLYPTLGFEVFDRSGLQRTFASQRRQRAVPQRMDMYVSSFDTYWINWYEELCQRWNIAELMRGAELPCNREMGLLNQEAFSQVIGKIHRLCTEKLKAIARYAANLQIQVSKRLKKKETKVAEYRGKVLRKVLESPSCALDKSVAVLVSGEELLKRGILSVDDKGVLSVDVSVLLKVSENEAERVIQWNTEQIDTDAGVICDKICKKAKCGKQKQCKEKLKGIIEKALQSYDPSGLLQPISGNKLRLYGERRSPLISELEEVKEVEARPIFRPFAVPCSTDLLAVPYNANVGLIAVNDDVFQAVLEYIRHLSQSEIEMELREQYKKLNGKLAATSGKAISACIRARSKAILESEAYATETWEEFFFLCHRYKKFAKLDDKHRVVLPFLIETRTFDTYLATFLEVLWSYGCTLDIHPDYTIEGFGQNKPGREPNLEKALLYAFNVFAHLFGESLVPKDSSLEVPHLVERARYLRDNELLPPLYNNKGEFLTSPWLFSRHWHSTLVDVLTHKDEKTKQYSIGTDLLGRHLRIMRIPIAMRYLAEQG